MATKKTVHPKDEALVCSEIENIGHMKERLDILHVLITGNGDPSKGLCRQVALLNEKQTDIFTKLGEIHTSLGDYHTETKEAKDVASTAASAIEKYKLEEQKYAEGVTAATIAEKVKKDLIMSRFLSVGGFIIALIMAYFAFKDLTKQNTVTQSQNTEIEKNTNMTNEILVPPGSAIRGTLYDPFLNDSTKNKEAKK